MGLKEGTGEMRNDEVVQFRRKDEGGAADEVDRLDLAEGCFLGRGLGGGDVWWEGCG